MFFRLAISCKFWLLNFAKTTDNDNRVDADAIASLPAITGPGTSSSHTTRTARKPSKNSKHTISASAMVASIVSDATRTTAPGESAPRSLTIVLASGSRFPPPLPSSSIDESAEAADAKQKCIAVLYKDNKFCEEKAFFLK
ncbi:unnamed protein product [Bathycoccus prasinos]